ncbi:MAG TPA: hypothetical protein VFL98_03230 [Candidatus Paceibacterota bacterium]|nr:hypothetical protein [Candidatus Paceibacterota bacterium]
MHARALSCCRIILACFAIAITAPSAAIAAQPADGLGSAVAVTVPFAAAPGDIIAYDDASGAYRLAQEGDSAIAGVAVADPPIVLFSGTAASGTPITRSGSVPVLVSLENGPIAEGDGIAISSVPGIGMRAGASSSAAVGTAQEAFDGTDATGTLAIGGRAVPEDAISVMLAEAGPGAGGDEGEGGIACTAGATACAIMAKINAAPLVALVRYLLAAALAFGSLFVAFRIFVANAINGIVSIGRNPLAKGAIQAMIILNAVLAAFIMVAGVGAGIAILLVQA